MSWLPFTLLYLGATGVAAYLGRRLLSPHWGRLVRVILFGTLLLLLGDAIATQRALWEIQRTAELYLLGAPIENFILVVATLLNSLLPYLYLRERAQSKSQ